MDGLFLGLSGIDFGKKFRNNRDCAEYLYSIKWAGGYVCTVCGCTSGIKGRTSLHRRCSNCKYDESVTCNTLFHGVRMPLLKAFHLIFRTVCKKKGMSSVELATEVGVQQKTAWKFKLKIKNAMVQESQAKLQGDVQVDETLVGGYSEGCVGRSLEEKTAVLIAVEDIGGGKTGNIRMEVIESFKADIIGLGMDSMVATNAKIKTDEHKSYGKLKKEGRDIEMTKSEKGASLDQLHKQIMCFKLWLRGTHHKCKPSYLQTYIDEYVFRFNSRNARVSIFNSIIFKFMNAVPKIYVDLIVPCVQNT
ncbi:IS1595 family transposase [Parasediminibacterium sp. JCM 36343]|uniref:IS1595 family transposase n=1 Tax=Parasediminibacterium sp. JCM 36343 TaxID=3374279 RepID=UPI003978CE5E